MSNVLHILNPGDREWTKHRYILAFGAYGNTYCMAWANSLEDALDECVDWIADHAPGLLADEAVRDEYERLRAEDPDLSEEDAQEEAEIDTTRAGNKGHYLNSWEWMIVAEDPSRPDVLDFLQTHSLETKVAS